MVRKSKTPVIREEPREETHMEIFRRLAAVINMHGHPGDRKPKGGGR